MVKMQTLIIRRSQHKGKLGCGAKRLIWVILWVIGVDKRLGRFYCKLIIKKLWLQEKEMEREIIFNKSYLVNSILYVYPILC